MNKKIFSAALFGALMALSAGTFTSCKDYDEDIENLQEQITDNASAIAALESQIKSGEWVQSVTSTADGIVVTLGNGTTYPINHGKPGEPGKNGVTPKIAVNNGKIQVSYDDGTTWTDLISLEDLKGEPGAPGESPIFSLGEDGHIYVQYGEDGEKKDLGVSTGGIYYVEEGVKLTIHVPNKDGEYKDIVLPRAAAISSIKAVTIAPDAEGTTDAELTDGASIELAYGKAAADGKYFDGTAFKEGDILLPSKEAKNVISAQVNPTIADATVYSFYLANSKGYSIFNLADATPNMTEDALTTKAATANKGIYDMGITFVDGVTAAQIDNAKGVYAIATKDAYDNEVLSAYDVKVNVEKATETTFTVKKTSKEVEINTDFDLNGLVEMKNVIDVQYYFAIDQTAAVDAAKATITGTKIKGEVANKTVKVSVKYLTYEGKVKEVEEKITVKFINPATENAYTKELILKADNDENKLTFDLTSLFGNTTPNVAASQYTIGQVLYTAAGKDKNTDSEYAKDGVAVGFTAPTAISSNAAADPANGYYKHTLTYEVNNAKVIPGTYKAEFKYGSSPVNTVKLTLIVKEDVTAYDFKPLPLYFNGNAATAYGTPDFESGKINYNLKGLFGLKEWKNVTFSETVPEDYKADGIDWSANAWLADATSGNITVDKVRSKDDETKKGNFGGAYEARPLKVTYTPYANKNLTAIEYAYNLTIKSAVFEGSLDYVKEVRDNKGNFVGYAAGDAKEIAVADKDAKQTLDGGEIRGVTATNVVYFGNSNADAYNKAGIKQAISVALDETAQQYLEIARPSFWDGDLDKITITPKAEVTAPATSLTCNIVVSVVDEWGKTKTVNVPVVLK